MVSVIFGRAVEVILKCANDDFNSLNAQSQKQPFVLFLKTELF